MPSIDESHQKEDKSKEEAGNIKPKIFLKQVHSAAVSEVKSSTIQTSV